MKLPRPACWVIAGALHYAAQSGARVISMSFGGYSASDLLRESVDYARSQGAILVAAAGNDNMDVVSYPAGYPGVIAVAATAGNDTKAAYSNFGVWVDVAAPGGDNTKDSMILSTVPRSGGGLSDPSGYRFLQGTSMACPYAAGAAALLLSRNPGLDNESLAQMFRYFSDAVGLFCGNPAGCGRVNVYRSVQVEAFGLAVTSPRDRGFVRGRLEIIGSAALMSPAENFQVYELCVARADDLGECAPISRSSNPVEGGLLGEWETTAVPDGDYVVTLTLTTTTRELETSVQITVDNYNEPPAFATLPRKGAVVGRENTFRVEARDPDDPQTPWGQFQASFWSGSPSPRVGTP